MPLPYDPIYGQFTPIERLALKYWLTIHYGTDNLEAMPMSWLLRVAQTPLMFRGDVLTWMSSREGMKGQPKKGAWWP